MILVSSENDFERKEEVLQREAAEGLPMLEQIEGQQGGADVREGLVGMTNRQKDSNCLPLELLPFPRHQS